MACSVASITSDANVLSNELRLIAQRNLLQHQEPVVPCGRLATALCDARFGGRHPVGVSLLHIGRDKPHGSQLYQSDPSRNYGGWKAARIGNNSTAAVSMFKQDYKEGETTLKCQYLLQLSKSSRRPWMLPNPLLKKVEIGPLTRENGKACIRVLKQKEVELLVKKKQEEEAKAEREKKEKEQREKDNIEDKMGDFRSQIFGHRFRVKAVLFHTEKALAFCKTWRVGK